LGTLHRHIHKSSNNKKSAAVENETHGFQKCGILPFYRYLFTDLDFAFSEVHFVASVDLWMVF
jgi:hypothetical protein